MADTLLTVVQRVLRATGQDPSITEFSDDDDTQFIVDEINKAMEAIRTLNPTHLDSSSTHTITAGTRLYTVTAGLDVYDINRASLRLDDGAISWMDVMNLIAKDKEFDTRTGPTVQYVYYENNKIGVYPILETGATSQTLKYTHPEVYTRLVNPADTFPYPDPVWITYCERKAKLAYELFKGSGNPIATNLEVEEAWSNCSALAIQTNRMQVRGYRRYGRGRV